MKSLQRRFVRLGEFDLFEYLVTPITIDGGTWDISQESVATLYTSAYKKKAKGTTAKFDLRFTDAIVAAKFRAFCVKHEQVSADEILRLFNRDANWYYKVWGINLAEGKPQAGPMGYRIFIYSVTCILFSPYAYSTWATKWLKSNSSLPQTSDLINNNDGHYDGAIESLLLTCSAASHVTDLMLAQSDNEITITPEALAGEIWELRGDNTLLETYEDDLQNSTKYTQDATSTGSYGSGNILLNNGQYAYYIFNSGHRIKDPITLTANLSLDSGGATGKAYVEISSDGISWTEALNQSQFKSGSSEYILQDTEYRSKLYIRFRCMSGTSGKYLRVSYIKVKILRWIEKDLMPCIAAGTSDTFTLTGDGQLSINGIFRARRKFS